MQTGDGNKQKSQIKTGETDWFKFNYGSSKFFIAPGNAFISQGTVATVEFCCTKKHLRVVSLHKLKIHGTI